MILGLYPSILETDNRLVLPDGVRGQYKDGMYVARGFDRNIMVLTMQAFETIYNKVTSLNLADPVARLLLRMILGTTYRTEIESDGKVGVPEALVRFANLERDVVLVGQGDFLELWSPDDWRLQEEKLMNVDAGIFSTLDIKTR